MSNALPDYAEFEQALAPAAGGYLTPAELHGFLCGLVAGGQPLGDPSWRPAVVTLLNDSEALPESALPYVEALYPAVCQGFAEMGFALVLYLPDDGVSLPERLEALGLWCQGFLAGFSVAPKPEGLSDDVNEAIKDLSAISQIDRDVEPNEEMETAFMEVAEHVRLSAQLIYAELGEKPSNDDKQSVH